MKKSAIVLTVIASVAIIAVAGYLKFSATGSINPNRFFSEDTWAVVEIINLSDQINEFKQSRLSKEIEKINIDEVMANIKMPKKETDVLLKSLQEADNIFNSPVFKALTGKHFAIGFMPLTKEELSSIDKQTPQQLSSLVQSKVAMIMKPVGPVKMVEFLRPLLPFLDDVKTSVAETYKGYELQEIPIDKGLAVFNAIVDDFIVVTLDIKTMKERIDTYVNNDKTLCSNSVYSSVKEKAAKGENGFAFINMQQVVQMLTKLVETLPAKDSDKDTKKQFLKNISDLAGVKGIGISTYKAVSGVSNSKFVMICDKTKVAGTMKQALETEPVEAFPLKMAPADTQMFYWANTVDLKSFVYDSIPPEKDIKQISQMTLSLTGMELDQILEAFGNEFGFLLTKVNTGGFFPIPEFTIYAKVNDEKSLATLFTTLLNRFGASSPIPLKPQTETYGDDSLTYVMLPYGDDLRPAYTFHNNYLLFGSSIKHVKKVLDTEKENNGLTTSPQFKNVDFGLTGKNNAVSYININKTLDTANELILWGNGMLAISKPEAVELSGILTEKVVTPVINGLKMYDSYGARSYADDGVLYGETYVKEQM